MEPTPIVQPTGVPARWRREARLSAMDSLIDTADPAAAATPAQPSEEAVAVLVGAEALAREAVIEFSGDTVGAYLGMSIEDDAAATHRFLATLPGYHGWQWAVVVAACPGSGRATISEVVLVPGPTALLAPPWLPWEQRVRPGDLGPGDLLAPLPDDPRLVPGFVATGDPLIDDTAQDVGFGRRLVLSAFGREDTAQRWHDGDRGPEGPIARATKRTCRDCGFMVPLAGALGSMFGVCCNEMSVDGQVVDFFFGCGAHSDTPAPAGLGSPSYEPFDDGVLDVVTVERLVVEPVADLTPSVPDVETQAAPDSDAEAMPDIEIEIEPAAEPEEPEEPAGLS